MSTLRSKSTARASVPTVSFSYGFICLKHADQVCILYTGALFYMVVLLILLGVCRTVIAVIAVCHINVEHFAQQINA